MSSFSRWADIRGEYNQRVTEAVRGVIERLNADRDRMFREMPQTMFLCEHSPRYVDRGDLVNAYGFTVEIDRHYLSRRDGCQEPNRVVYGPK